MAGRGIRVFQLKAGVRVPGFSWLGGEKRQVKRLGRGRYDEK